MRDAFQTNRFSGWLEHTFQVVVVAHRRVPLRCKYEGSRPAVTAPSFPLQEERLDSGRQVYVAVAARSFRVVQTTLAERLVDSQMIGIMRVPVVPSEREQTRPAEVRFRGAAIRPLAPDRTRRGDHGQNRRSARREIRCGENDSPRDAREFEVAQSLKISSAGRVVLLPDSR